MTNRAIIFCHSITPRLRYVVDFLSRYYGAGFQLTPDEDRYRESSLACRINYSFHRLEEGEIYIHPHALLFETAIRPVKAECFTHQGVTAFFRANSDTGFDLLAAIFYCITRYEEYLPHRKDHYGRYAHLNSLAFRENFLDLPLVNIWLEKFRELLAQREPAFSQAMQGFRFVPTYDIDMAWSFRNKGFRRNAGSMLKLLFRARFRQFLHRLRVLKGKRPDPFDAYEWLDELHRRYGLEPVYFFLVAQQKGKYDRNIDPDNEEFRELISQTAGSYETGLHPSWASGDIHHLLSREKKLLEEISGKAIISSRQHYIRFELPDTYRRLVQAGISRDYSMGYGSVNGFRASIASPYYWYDLKNEEMTGLLIYPFCFMDANAYFEQKLEAAQALAELEHYLREVRKVNGSMITIWHNSFLGNTGEFAGWRGIYEKFVSSLPEINGGNAASPS